MNIKTRLTVPNLLTIFIILCPIFDISSYIFKNIFKTEISISTVLRPIIPVIIGLYIFVKANKKEKIIFVIIGTIYASYAIAHLVVSKNMFMGCAYGTIKNEVQYVINFTFLIIYFVIYNYIYIKTENNKEFEKIKDSVAIMACIYIVSIILAIITKTSEYTYVVTNTGYKGWIAQGNSLSAILIMSMFILLSNLKKTQFKKLYISTIIITTIYLFFVIGTRAALIGACIALFMYIITEIIFSRNKKVIAITTVLLVIGGTFVAIFGSNTITRRKQIQRDKYTIIDKSTGEVGTMTGDMLDLKNNILANNVPEGYMTEAQKQAVLDLYEFSQKHNLAGNDTRTQQLMYNFYLVKNQKNLLTLLFGNGYKSNVGEMVMENELASIPLNFGLIGCILYVGPIAIVLLHSVIFALKNKKILNAEYIMCQSALFLALVLSWFSGYVLFSMSCMIMIAVLTTLINNKIKMFSIKIEKQHPKDVAQD